MNLRLERDDVNKARTIGELTIDGEFECFTLEDPVREVAGMPVGAWKVLGKTAIPRGRYEVDMTMSARFGKIMPQVMGVPGFEGIRIHSGNTTEDTEGCLLVGTVKTADSILNSRVAFLALYTKFSDAVGRGDKVFITIV